MDGLSAIVVREQFPTYQFSEFMRYLVSGETHVGARLPPLSELSRQLGISVASLREQLEVARAMGLVEVRPRTGIRRLPYTFKPSVVRSLFYALSTEPEAFRAFSDLRNHIEATYWYQAVGLLTPEDHQSLRSLISRAKEKLHGNPIQIPHLEHRQLHLLIYRRLNNPFVNGLLEAFWEVYEAIGLDVYTDLAYQELVWEYHDRLVEAICKHNFDVGYEALMEHIDLIFQRTKKINYQNFE